MKKVGVIAGLMMLLLVGFIGLRTIDIPERVIDLSVVQNNTRMCFIVSKMDWLSLGYPTSQPSADDCRHTVALAHKNLNACETSSRGGADYCYKSVAEKYNDISVCERIAASSLSKGACYGLFMKTKTDIT